MAGFREVRIIGARTAPDEAALDSQSKVALVVPERHADVLEVAQSGTVHQQSLSAEHFAVIEIWAVARVIDELAEEVRDALLADPRLLRDVADETSPDPADAAPEVWRAYMRKNPIVASAGETRADPSSAPFALVDETLLAKLDVAPELRAAVEELVAEIVDWRLVRHLDDLQARQRGGTDHRGGPVVAQLKVAQSTGGRPILFLRREHNPPLPHGEVEVLAEGQPHMARFVKVACNVLARSGSNTNVLPEVLRGWFGADAGASGTHHKVELASADAEQGWQLRPVDPTG